MRRRASRSGSEHFALLRRQRLTEALAFDGEFSAAGFVEVRASG